MDYKQWAQRFADIGSQLTQRRNLDELLSVILREIMDLTSSDGGSIYRAVESEDERLLRFEMSMNQSIDLPDQHFTLPIDKSSIAGYVADIKQPLNIDNAYNIPDEASFSFSPEFDDTYDYHTRSLLVVPLTTRKGEIQGVLQLVNRKQDPEADFDQTELIAYSDVQEELVWAFASQIAVSIERAELEESVETMMESMIQTLVTALDRRDEITTGHSQRIARYALSLAEEIDSTEQSAWQGVSISDTESDVLYYSGLLHDIGKIAVPEDILGKENRLTDDNLEAIRYRLAYIEASDQAPDALSHWNFLRDINESGYLQDSDLERLKVLRDKTFLSPENTQKQWLTEEEFNHLSVQKGNLTPNEREIINSHARVTRDVLQSIEWTSQLEGVPEIASMHHEKLNGDGYPRGLGEDELPLLARILCVVDIYEALTARDRPYKPAMNPEEAMDILWEEADNNAIDEDIVELFESSGIYRSVLDSEW